MRLCRPHRGSNDLNVNSFTYSDQILDQHTDLQPTSLSLSEELLEEEEEAEEEDDDEDEPESCGETERTVIAQLCGYIEQVYLYAVLNETKN